VIDDDSAIESCEMAVRLSYTGETTGLSRVYRAPDFVVLGAARIYRPGREWPRTDTMYFRNGMPKDNPARDPLPTRSDICVPDLASATGALEPGSADTLEKEPD